MPAHRAAPPPQDQLLQNTIDLLDQLIAHPTVAPAPNRALVDLLANRLSDAGARVDILGDDHKASLWATLGPDTDGGIVLSGHTDVVPVTDQNWASDPFCLTERDGRLFGRGTCDMKGFVAAATAMAPYFDTTTRPVHFSFTQDEETDCIGVANIMAHLTKQGLRPAMALIGEPTEMRMIEGHKGCCEYVTDFKGAEGHSSAPDLGVNAVEYAVRFSQKLLSLQDDLIARAPQNRFSPPYSTLNIGVVQGGTAFNVIAPKARVEWDLRPINAQDLAFVKSEVAAFETALCTQMQHRDPTAYAQTRPNAELAPLEPRDQNSARDLVAWASGANGADLVAFGTEGGAFQAQGMDVIVCGPGSIDQAHKADEYIQIDQLDACLTLLQRLTHG